MAYLFLETALDKQSASTFQRIMNQRPNHLIQEVEFCEVESSLACDITPHIIGVHLGVGRLRPDVHLIPFGPFS